MDYKERVQILNKYFDKHVEQKDLKNMRDALDKMSSIHGQVVNSMIEMQKSNSDDKLKILSNLQIVSSDMSKLIKKNMQEYDKLASNKEEKHVSTELSEKLNKDVPSLILFFADWCGPCKMFLPTWNKLAEINKRDDINLVKFSCVKHKDKCDKISLIQSYPTLVLYNPKDNSLVKFEGNRSTENIKGFVKHKVNVELKI